MIAIDASEIIEWASASDAAASRLNGELGDATDGLLAEGVGLAKGNAPIQDGDLSNSIHIMSSSALSGEYGTSMEYAWMREEGGTITARNAPYLVFQVQGRWVKVKSVTQTGTKYMERSADELEPKIEPAYAAALARAMAGMGGL